MTSLMDLQTLITIVQVGMSSEEALFRHEYSKRLESGLGQIPWILVDNDSGKLTKNMQDVSARFILGETRTESIDRHGQWSHSLHHANSLDLALRKCETKYALVLDPDFIVTDWKALLFEFSQFIESDFDFLGTPWFPTYPEKTPKSVAPHLCFMNLERATAKRFSWSKGIFQSEVISLSETTNLELKDKGSHRDIKNSMKKFATSSASHVKILKTMNQIRLLSIKRSMIGVYPDTGSESAKDAYRKNFLVPILTSQDLNQISPLFKFKFFCRREKSKSVQSRLLPDKWGLLEGMKEFKVGDKNVEPFASSLGICVGFHLRSYSHLLANNKVEEIMGQLKDIETALSIEKKVEFGEL